MTLRQAAESWFDHVWNLKDQKWEDYVRYHLRPKATITGVGTQNRDRSNNPSQAGPSAAEKQIRSVEEFIAFRRGIVDAIPNVQVAIEHFTESGDQASGIARISGTDKVSKREVSFQLGFWLKIQDDTIVDAANVVDFYSYLLQAGIIENTLLTNHLGIQA